MDPASDSGFVSFAPLDFYFPGGEGVQKCRGVKFFTRGFFKKVAADYVRH
jgi:hypothetical protein